MAPAGLWGKPSSTVDWCEENYAVTRYIAEFWNTVSNVLLIVPPIVTIFLLIEQRFEKKFIACHLSLLSVGIGSWCFHMTLLYSMQLLDELPMIWGTGLIIYAYIEVKSPPSSRNLPLMVGVLTYCSVVTGVYIFCKEPIFFQAAYAIQIILVVFVCIRTSRTLERSDQKICFQGALSAGTGCCLWLIDTNFCSTLSYLKASIGPLAPVLEFHAWWHLLIGMGAYLSLIFVAHARCLVLQKPAYIRYWMNFWPYLHVDTPVLIK